MIGDVSDSTSSDYPGVLARYWANTGSLKFFCGTDNQALLTGGSSFFQDLVEANGMKAPGTDLTFLLPQSGTYNPAGADLQTRRNFVLGRISRGT
jgi:hypothetical protein